MLENTFRIFTRSVISVNDTYDGVPLRGYLKIKNNFVFMFHFLALFILHFLLCWFFGHLIILCLSFNLRLLFFTFKHIFFSPEAEYFFEYHFLPEHIASKKENKKSVVEVAAADDKKK